MLGFQRIDCPMLFMIVSPLALTVATSALYPLAYATIGPNAAPCVSGTGGRHPSSGYVAENAWSMRAVPYAGPSEALIGTKDQ